MDHRAAVIDTVTRVAWYADHRRWDAIPELFADPVRLDYTSLMGGEPASVTPADIARSWQATLGGLDATQHAISSHLVDLAGDGNATATATAQFVATHVLANPHGSPLWVLGGHYRWTLRRSGERWLIDSLTMTATWATGNQQLMTLAAARVAQST